MNNADFGVGQPYARTLVEDAPLDVNKLQPGKRFVLNTGVYAYKDFFTSVSGKGTVIRISLGIGLQLIEVLSENFKVTSQDAVILLEPLFESNDYNDTISMIVEAKQDTPKGLVKVEWAVIDPEVKDMQPLNNFSTLLYTIATPAIAASTTTTTTKKPRKSRAKKA